MYAFVSLIVVSAALYFWLWELNRGVWKTVLTMLAESLAWLLFNATALGYLAGIVCLLGGLVNRELSTIAWALVILAAARLLEYVHRYYHPVALLQSFIERLEAKKEEEKEEKEEDEVPF